ncbi:hypothetical protein [Desulfosporosinus nitroreducens]|uniref:hypothetical protein n=1 Tax=Desulfosporosinus nitroreducens TaxID=2018668 RepID=UPI00207C1F8F|nr:hypothetical protein [Desulfosporosinus nitroreducens]MCO1599768.1 hypothetical protein [Desulfosporosinus nitroreducens]
MPSLSTLLQYAYKKVDERDQGVCQHPGCCSSYKVDHHHIEFRSEARDRVACVENIVTLCQVHHHGKEGPHESALWREYWKQWQREKYPYYMSKIEQNELERLRLKRFIDQRILLRLDELEEKRRVWEECKIAV